MINGFTPKVIFEGPSMYSIYVLVTIAIKDYI